MVAQKNDLDPFSVELDFDGNKWQTLLDWEPDEPTCNECRNRGGAVLVALVVAALSGCVMGFALGVIVANAAR
jgi:hypothetical protein